MTEEDISAPEGLLDDWMPRRELAGIIGVSSDTLKRWETRRIGPPCIRIGRKVLYPVLNYASVCNQEKLSEFSERYEISNGPRESFLAERNQRLGQIDRELLELSRLRERASELEELSARKAEVQVSIDKYKDRQKALEAASAKRRRTALTRVSEKAKSFLRQDLDRQDEFRQAKSVEVNFRDNSILTDGDLNFAESSNVIAKNSVILALFSAALEDKNFLHPRFLLMDNVEDKGMEDQRSHNFQKIMVQACEGTTLDHQIIFTTSTINSVLNSQKYTIGPFYTHDHRTLRREGDAADE